MFASAILAGVLSLALSCSPDNLNPETMEMPTEEEKPKDGDNGNTGTTGPATSIDHTKTYEFATEELWSSRDGMKIYGQIYVPKGIDVPMPALVFSHGFGGSHTTGASYARELASHGYVVYCFDFCGATSSSRSDGKTTDMSIFSEESDLLAVMETIRLLDFVDAEELYLIGTSQGGMVSAMAAADKSEYVKAAILIYPALCIADNAKEWFGTQENIPETYNLWGVTLGRAYFERLFGYDTFGHIKKYDGPVLIIHGDKDSTVPVSYAYRAAETYDNATLKIIEGAGHGFYGGSFDLAMGYISEFLSHLPSGQNTSKSVLDTEIHPIPADYQKSSNQKGEVVRLDYTTTSYASGQKVDRYAYVYLPYGYKENPDRRYNTFYLMHGGGGSEETYFSAAGRESTLKLVLDNMIEKGDMEPAIIVTPSFYLPDDGNTSVSNSATAVKEFPKELVTDLIPAVDDAFRTVAERDGRAFSGFSMGSVCTWYVFLNALSYFHDFVPLSGDCWAVATQGGRSYPDETAERLAKAVTEQKFTPSDFYIHIMTGSEDIAEPMLTAQIAAMKKLNAFTFDADKSKGNVWYGVLDGGVHTFSYDLQYVYNALLNLWK